MGAGRGRGQAGGGTGSGLRLRALFVGLLLFLGFGAVLARAAKVQLFDQSRLQRLARDQTRHAIEWAPRRGPITDRKGAPLAVTQDVDSVFADPSAFRTDEAREAAAEELGRALGVPAKRLRKKLGQPDRHFVWLQRRIDEAAAERVRALGLDGVELVKEPKRFYPQHELAGQVLGFVGEEAGQEGLERELEPLLKGRKLSLPALRDARGRTVLPRAPEPHELTGATVTTTLDLAIQHAAERELSAAVREFHAAAGWAVVMDVRSGAILALAGSPSFDANKPGRDPAIWRNHAVQDQLEPGSTIKSFLIATALEQRAIGPQELFWCEEGSWRTFGRTLHDTHPIGWADPTLILKESSNICAAKVGLKLGPERLVAGLKAFGFGERSQVGLPGEGRGQLREPARLGQIGTATTAFGQGMSATALQTVAAMAAIANGGVLLRPYLVEQVVGADGQVLLRRGRSEVRRVLQPRTAQRVAAMLEEVTRKGGTGTKAALADFRVAGKTGTAQKVDPVRGGYGDKRLASFLGFVPAEAPRLAIIVAIDEPEGKVYGGEVAAPAWGRIATEALRQLGVAPVSRQEEVALRDDQKKERDRQAAKAAALLAAKAAQQARAAQQAAEQASRQAASGAKEGKAAPVRPAAGPNPAAPAQPDLIKDSAKEAPAAVAGPVAEVGP